MIGGLIVCLVVLAGATAFGIAWRRRDGRLAAPGSAAAGGGLQLGAAELGQPLGPRATLLQFSSEFCAPCRATRQILADVASGTEGVRHVEVDAGERMDLVRRLDVRRTPTVFVLGPDGRVARRGSGLMNKADVLHALGEVRAG
ncbi:MAG TPA: thioredoxin family protein [Streptosporangiaceae bacterium]|nr:thioredoxin family protein [Streptosporangiaceae bacterium]